MPRILLVLVMMLSALWAVGCSDDDDDSFNEDAGTDSDTDTDVDGGDDDPWEPVCWDETDALVFDDVENAAGLRTKAADFQVETADGTWRLSDHWNGCDTYLLIPDYPNQNTGDYGYHFWEDDGDVASFLAALPRNTHVLFMSEQQDEADRTAAIDALSLLVQDGLDDLPDDDAQSLSERLVFVTERAGAIGGWVGTMMNNPGFGFGIDRFQRIRYIGSFGDQVHYVASESWPFGPNVAMAANEAVYYNFEALREHRLNGEDAQVFTLWDDVAVASLSPADPYATVTFPSASSMADFDSMELDLFLGCGGVGEVGYCPAWDYNAYLYLCDEADPTVCDTEVGHWITSYHREGRWVHDVSGLLPLLATGGARTFKIAIDDPWYVSLSVRLFDSGKTEVPTEAVELFTGNDHFGPDYNDNYSPVTVAIPSDAVKVELATAITGHGMQSPGNCAEFCNHTHHFWVNGTENVLDNPIAGSSYGCMEQIGEGTVPNQYGTWWYGRGGWCPGKQVDMLMTDITDQVTLGADNTFDYEGLYNGADYTVEDGWQYIRLASWVVISK